MNHTIYKICSRALWNTAQQSGRLEGAPVDLADGFIHFSAAHQVAATAEKHFAGQGDLLLLAVDTELLGDALKWEVSRGGDLFPHLYGPLSVSAVTALWPLPLDEVGRHEFPAGLVDG